MAESWHDLECALGRARQGLAELDDAERARHESALDHFAVYLALLREATEERERDMAAIAFRSPLKGIRLLFVDDEPALRSGMQAFGEMRGFTVLTASDGVAALETARNTGVDAVVCDLRMPGMDGYAFHEQLRQEQPGLASRTVFITGDVIATASSRSSVARQPVLTKPFAFDRIEEALIAVMRGMPYGSARG